MKNYTKLLGSLSEFEESIKQNHIIKFEQFLPMWNHTVFPNWELSNYEPLTMRSVFNDGLYSQL